MSASTGVQERSVPMVFVLGFITLGLYFLWVTHQYHTEFEEESELDPGMSPAVRTILFLIPIANLYGMWLFFSDVETLTGESAGKLFILSFFIVGWWMALSSLNSYAAGS